MQESEQQQQKRSKNIKFAIGFGLFALVVYVASMMMLWK